MSIANKPRVIVAMSGGVDSSVSALLLQQQGYPVEGMFMKNWEEDDTETYCAASQDVSDAQAVCDKLGIKLHRVNFATEYWNNVFETFLQEYRLGRTPNPDILCNREIKFKAFLDYACHLGADYMATGHYVRSQCKRQQQQLLTAQDQQKDQSYFLYTLGQAQLAASLFPLGDLTKPQVRQIAQQHGFSNHAKKDSTGICFIGERRFKQFLQRYIQSQPGPIQTVAGQTIGEHAGLMFYTLGQRQGLGIGGLRQATEVPWYVAQKDQTHNVLVVVQGHDHPLLFNSHLVCTQLTWISGAAPGQSFACQAKVRYRQQAVPCQVKINANAEQADIHFTHAQWAITPGQSVVFYQDECCLGGGIIENAYS